MQIFDNIKDFRQWRNTQSSVAFVPTMGNLHAGHLSLVQCAKQAADAVVVSIFVNPTQFGAGEDFESYPRTLHDDCQKLQAAKVAAVFAPKVEQMYPQYALEYAQNSGAKTSGMQNNHAQNAGIINNDVQNNHVHNDKASDLNCNHAGASMSDGKAHPAKDGIDIGVQVLFTQNADILCGASRPNHFAGVALVLCKLFNIVRPTVAVFGQKDYQQLFLVKQLVRALNFDIKIIAAPIAREEDGLALSSRNQYLTHAQRKTAPMLYQILQYLAQNITKNASIDALHKAKQHAVQALSAHGFLVDYVQILDEDLQPVTTALPSKMVVLVAAKLGRTRLIDNIEIALA